MQNDINTYTTYISICSFLNSYLYLLCPNLNAKETSMTIDMFESCQPLSGILWSGRWGTTANRQYWRSDFLSTPLIIFFFNFNSVSSMFVLFQNTMIPIKMMSPHFAQPHLPMSGMRIRSRGHAYTTHTYSRTMHS